MQIIPIAGGKGGVGKSLLSANLAIALAQANKKVILADLDLGASNLHVALGISSPKAGIGTFIAKKHTFDECLLPTFEPNLLFLSGDSELAGFAALKIFERNLLLKNLLRADADFLVLDLGAGTHIGILDFFLLSKRGIIITTPSITATLNAYLFLKNTMFRMLYTSFKKKTPGALYLESLRRDVTIMQRMYIPKILDELQRIDPKGTDVFLGRMKGFNPRIVMNMIDNPQDAEKVSKIQHSCKQYLNIDLEHLGVMYRDNIQSIALASRLPVVRYKPDSLISQAVYRIADKIMQSDHDDSAAGSDSYMEFLDDSFNTAELEAKIDFESRMEYVEGLLNTNDLTAGDLAEMIKAQQYEISILRKENLLLKSKIKKMMT